MQDTEDKSKLWLENKKLKNQIKEMAEAMQEFIERCEKGKAMSRYTYSKFKKILSKVGGCVSGNAD